MTPVSKLFAIGFWLLLMLASARLVAPIVLRGQPDEIAGQVLYQAGTLAFSYLEFGAIRRGLGGTIAGLLSSDPVHATLAFHFLAAAAVAFTAAWLLRRLSARPAASPVVYALAMVVIMVRWGGDAGRTDMAVAAFLGGAAIALSRRRLALAAACVGVGLFIHESAFIFGLPLLAALCLQAGRWRALPWSERRGALACLALALAVYGGMRFLPQADVRTMVDTIRGRFIPHEHIEWAMYFALSGMRGVVTSVCQNLADPSYWVHPVSGLVVMGFLGCALLPDRWADWRRAMLATLPSFVFLSVFANDISRWAMFGCFNIWLLCAVKPASADTVAGTRPRWRLAAALALVPLVLLRPSIVEYRIYAPSPLIEAAARALGGPRTPSVEEALQRCDPTWSAVLDAPR